MVEFSKALGYSEDSGDVFVGSEELDYRKTGNPMCVWNAILRMNEIGMTHYPVWVSKYLVQSARNLKTCDATPKGPNGIVAAFGLKGKDLYEMDIEALKIMYQLMRKKIGSGLTIEEAALQTEEEIDHSNEKALGEMKPQPGQRGYYGNSLIEKIYRQLRDADQY